MSAYEEAVEIRDAIRDLRESRTSPERYVRINITKNSKGYSDETTVSLRWADDNLDYIDEISHLNRIADELACGEIDAREKADVDEIA